MAFCAFCAYTRCKRQLQPFVSKAVDDTTVGDQSKFKVPPHGSFHQPDSCLQRLHLRFVTVAAYGIGSYHGDGLMPSLYGMMQECRVLEGDRGASMKLPNPYIRSAHNH